MYSFLCLILSVAIATMPACKKVNTGSRVQSGIGKTQPAEILRKAATNLENIRKTQASLDEGYYVDINDLNYAKRSMLKGSVINQPLWDFVRLIEDIKRLPPSIIKKYETLLNDRIDKAKTGFVDREQLEQIEKAMRGKKMSLEETVSLAAVLCVFGGCVPLVMGAALFLPMAEMTPYGVVYTSAISLEAGAAFSVALGFALGVAFLQGVTIYAITKDAPNTIGLGILYGQLWELAARSLRPDPATGKVYPVREQLIVPGFFSSDAFNKQIGRFFIDSRETLAILAGGAEPPELRWKCTVCTRSVQNLENFEEIVKYLEDHKFQIFTSIDEIRIEHGNAAMPTFGGVPHLSDKGSSREFRKNDFLKSYANFFQLAKGHFEVLSEALEE